MPDSVGAQRMSSGRGTRGCWLTCRCVSVACCWVESLRLHINMPCLDSAGSADPTLMMSNPQLPPPPHRPPTLSPASMMTRSSRTKQPLTASSATGVVGLQGRDTGQETCVGIHTHTSRVRHKQSTSEDAYLTHRLANCVHFLHRVNPAALFTSLATCTLL